MGTELFGVDIAGILADQLGPGLPLVALSEPVSGARTPGNLTAGRQALPPKSYTARGLWEDFKGPAPAGVTVLTGDRKALILGDTIDPPAVPGPGWSVTIEGVTLWIVQALTRDPAAAHYVYQCRDRAGPDKV